MTFLRNQRLLFLFAALLFAVGHAHQVLGRFEAHHHGFEMRTVSEMDDHDTGAHDEDHGDRQKDADHMVADHAVIAVVPALMVPPIGVMHGAALVDVRAVEMPEAPVAGIDHPPQLRG